MRACENGHHNFLGDVFAGDPCTCGVKELAIVPRGAATAFSLLMEIAKRADAFENCETDICDEEWIALVHALAVFTEQYSKWRLWD